MKHAWIVVVMVAAVAGVAAAQPQDPYAPVDPYADPPKPGTKPGKAGAKTPKTPKTPAGKKPEDPPAGGVVDPYGDRGAGVGMGGDPPSSGLLDGPKSPPDPTTGLTPPVPTPVREQQQVQLVGRFDLAAVQGLLAVQNLDGWLIVDHNGSNPVARSLVAIQGASSRRWFYLVPRTGEPTVLCHASEASSFAAVPGAKLTYTGYRDLDKNLRALLKGRKTLAMEYSPKGALPSLSRVDAGTIELVRAGGVVVKPSDGLVQFAKATWGPEGRKKHYIAVHHLVELRKEALGYIAKQLQAGAPVTEREVQVRIEKGMTTRGLIGPAPVVAFGKNSADPDYVPAAGRAATLVAGDVVVISLAGKVEGGMFAALTWIAVADSVVNPKVQVAFETAALARDEALALVSDRIKRRRAVKGWEVDKAARDFLTKAGMIDRVLHRTGHSLDGDLNGSGTDLDDLEVKDQRNVVVGTGFTIGPGIYYPGELGVRAEVSAYLGKDGLEVTTPVQEIVETLVPKK